MPTLAEYYRSLGLSDEAWHLGPEHPGLEQLALRVLAGSDRARILEIGVQSGGFAVPVIVAAAGRPGFSYTGVDSLAYTNAVPLSLIAAYLERIGIHAPIRFIEGDSTPVLRAARAQSYDLILLDHYKPKYPIDFYIICRRSLLGADGAILVHDVLAHARADWKVCEQVARAYGYTWTIDADVPQGAAIVRRSGAARRRALAAFVGCHVTIRWYAHASTQGVRRAAGRVLRGLGLRRGASGGTSGM